jgi:hypothetical protein
MDDKKFNDMLNDWAAHEQKTAPRLRPKPEMYEQIRANRPRIWFPVFARWAAVGVAAMIIVTVAVLHPNLVPVPMLQDETPREESTVTASKNEQLARQLVPETVKEKKDTPDTAHSPEPAPMAVTALQDEQLAQEERRTLPPSVANQTLESPKVQQEKLMAGDDMPGKSVSPSSEPVEGIALQPAAPDEPQPAASDEVQMEAKRSTAPDDGARSRILSEVAKPAPSQSPQVGFAADTEEEALLEVSEDVGDFRDKDASRKKARIGKKTFFLKDNVWIDADYDEGDDLLTIQRESPAYREVLEAFSEFKHYVDVGEHLIVVVGDIAVEIAAEGQTTLTAEERKLLGLSGDD